MAQPLQKTERSGGLDWDTIAAAATPPGRGGVGIIRVSGPRAMQIGATMCGQTVVVGRVAYRTFSDEQGRPVDQGLVLSFRGPRSFTGEDVIELHGHGGPVVMDVLLRAALALGARIARPGEFTERAFHNGKIDLAQAEAVADLIASGSEAAARSAFRSLQGQFSALIHALDDDIVDLRVHVEGAIDFPEEELDLPADGQIRARLERLIERVRNTVETASQGAILNEGITLVLAGRPNVGKSSLLNRLLGYERAIVTNVPGTTRDVLSERLDLDGIPTRIVDTAGLRLTGDAIEQEGMRRALTQVAEADRVLLVHDDTTDESLTDLIEEQSLPTGRLTVVSNKIDLSGGFAGLRVNGRYAEVGVSALTGAGIDALKAHVKGVIGFRDQEGVFSARRRHLDALVRAKVALEHGALALGDAAAELLAEDLRTAHACLGEIVGAMSSDALLGEIFSRFCIGK